jgi:hypothetical protein
MTNDKWKFLRAGRHHDLSFVICHFSFVIAMGMQWANFIS